MAKPGSSWSIQASETTVRNWVTTLYPWAAVSRGQTIATFQGTIYPNIVGSAITSSGQTIATFECKISQFCRAQHVACIWWPCGDMFRHVENRFSVNAWAQHYCCTDLAKRLQHHATSANVAWKIWPFSNLIQQHPAHCLMSQHVATGWPSATNMLLPRVLRSFGRGLKPRISQALALPKTPKSCAP